MARARRAETGAQVLALAGDPRVALADRVARAARDIAAAVLGDGIAVAVMIFDRQGTLIGRSDG